MRKRLSLAVAAATVAPAPAPAATPVEPSAAPDDTPTLCERAWGARKAVKAKHGLDAVGRNICREGMRFKGRKPRPATPREKARYLAQLQRLNRPYVLAVPPPQPPAGTLTPTSGAPPAAIAACESKGDPGAVSPDGRYRGKWQFDMRTWASVGGSGDPAAASEAEQDYRAGLLYRRRGAAPWPVCGR